MKKIEFMFAVGFRDDMAIVDKKGIKKYSKYSFEELLEEGLYKPAFCQALYEDDEDKIQTVVDTYNKKTNASYKDKMDLSRLFGVFSVPEENIKIKYL